MKKSLLLLFVLILSVSVVATFSLSGCKEKEAPADDTAIDDTAIEEVATEEAAEEVSVESKKIGIMLSWGTHEWYVTVMDGFKSRAQELGIEYSLVDSEGDLEKGVSIIENFVEEGVDGILLFPATYPGYETGIKAAKAAGIPVIVDVVDMPDAPITGFAGNPQFNMDRETGLEIAKYIKENWPEDKEVNVLTVNIPAFPNLNGRTDGFLIGLLEGGVDFNWVEEVDGQGNLTTSLDVSIAAFTAHPEINLCLGINDDSMFGAYKAAEQQGLDMDEMIFAGAGLGGPEGRKSLLADNANKFGTSMFPATQGYIFVELFAELFKGNEIPYRTTFPSKATTADNFYDYYNEDLSENSAKISEIMVELSDYPITVGWDRGWYEVYKNDPDKFKEEYKY